MNHQEYLTLYKANLKMHLTESLEEALGKVQRIIKSTSDRKNEILQLEGRYFQLQQEVLKGIVDERDRVLRINRVRVELITFIDHISYSDIIEEEDAQFLEFQSQYERSKRQALDSIEDKVERDIEEPLVELQEEETSRAYEDKGIDDLELFCEMNRPLLVFFPKESEYH